MILEGDVDSTTAPKKHFNEIYIALLKQSINSNFTDGEREYLYYMLRKILRSIAVLFSLLPVNSLSKLLHVTEEVDQAIHGSVIAFGHASGGLLIT